MSEAFHLERKWLMDSFGCFLQYDSMQQTLITTAFTPQSFPNLFTFVPTFEKFPHRAILRLVNTIPSMLPPTRFVRIHHDNIAIQNIETNHFLCSHHQSPMTSWQEKIDAWEHFSLLSSAIICGLSILADPDMASIQINGHPADPLTFTGNWNHAIIAETDIKILENLREIGKLADSLPHQSTKLSLEKHGETSEKITLEITPNRNLLLNSSFI